jgi:Tol biopolymer transport system component
MALGSGTHIGPYEVTGLLGEGGMGEVYRATDTNLGRQVALKVLPQGFAQDSERLARFDREAKALAALNHPNIAAIYGLERTDATTALVMELVEGPTLADRIARGAMPLDEALPIARQLAEALEAAHEQGIVHRDLKPANIKVRADGTLKVLDFGLAKAVDPPSGPGLQAPALASSPTLTSPAMMTQAGILLGTAAYMSPEQARGKPVDRRTDVWAFGCVLYEMVTGRRAFPGTTITETLAAVLERDLDWTKLPETTPEGVRIVLRRALEKDPRRRLHDIADARIELEDRVQPQIARQGAAGRRTILRWLAALVATSAVVGIAAWHLKPAPRLVASTAAAVTRLVVEPEAPVPQETEGVLALSPDGRLLAYVGRSGGRRVLYLRELDSFQSRPVPGSEGADCPAFSPDGKWLAFAADHQVKKVAVAGGTPVPLCEFNNVGRGLGWESTDSILFSRGTSGIWRVPAAGGTPTAVTTLAGGEFEHNFPQMLPGGKALLFSELAAGAIGNRQMVVQVLETSERRRIGTGNGAQYLPTGHLVFVDGEGNVFAQPFDVASLQPKGSPTVVLQGVRQTQYGWPEMAISAAGSLAYVPAMSGERLDTVVWVDTAGREQPTALSGPDLSMPRLRPDLQRVAVIAQSDLWLYDLARDTRSRLTFEGSTSFPLWEPTGTKLAYRSARSGKIEIDVKSVDGTAPESRLSADPHMNVPLSWSPDGRFLAAVSVSPATANDIWIEDLTTGAVSPFVTTAFREGAPTFSGDGRWIAYASEQSGRSEIYVRPFPGPGQEITVSTDGGGEPVWARKAGRLFYRQGDAMMAVDITTAPTLVIGKPQRLFEGPYNRSNAFWPDYDVTPDGRRLLMVRRGARADATRIYMVLNWLEELKARVPAN